MAWASIASRGAPGTLSAATADATAVSRSVMTIGTNSPPRTRTSRDATNRRSIFPGTLRKNSVLPREPVARTTAELPARFPAVHRTPERPTRKRAVREPSRFHTAPATSTRSARPDAARKISSDG